VACFRSEDVTPVLWKQRQAAWPPSEHGQSEDPVLRLSGVRKSFTQRRVGRGRERRVEALRGIDLDVGDAESVSIVGESGSGKSTLLRIIAGLITPDQGSVTLRDRERPQMIYQDAYASLTPWLTVGDLVEERLRHRGMSKRDRRAKVGDALRQVGLNPTLAAARPPQLSGGQRQRVAVARAIVVPPRLLLCDEPVSAIDVSLAAVMLNLLQSLRLRLGLAMVFVTHDLAAARFVSDRIIVMRDGEVVETGPANDVVSSPSSDYTRELLAAIPSMAD
jgi:peptide/nickel transport system ATP-binding protein